jgi:MFS transporter, ACS family, hexuronate transporter
MEPNARPPAWKWTICGLLFLATMMMYMDRQTLAAMGPRIKGELILDNTQFGTIDLAFGMAFAIGSILNGLIADRLSIRWFYPVMLIGWSLAGVATGYGDQIGEFLGTLFPALIPAGTEAEVKSGQSFLGLIVCRSVLGYFESGHWPCALITTQRLLSGSDRALGNSVLQSGASIGAVLTPLVAWLMLDELPGSWRLPFTVIGLGGIAWIIPWLLLIRARDLQRPAASSVLDAGKDGTAAPDLAAAIFIRRFLVLLAVVIPINMVWQFFRLWTQSMLQEQHHYSEQFVFFFSAAFYLVADVGCIAVGSATKVFTSRDWTLQQARVTLFSICTVLVLIGMTASQLQAGWPLLGILLLVGCGALGFFPTYYSLTQDMSRRHQGLIGGTLGATTWVVTSLMQRSVGKSVDLTKSYGDAIFWICLTPLIAWVALTFFWGRSPTDPKAVSHG